MPFYEYECSKCKTYIERITKVSERDSQTCKNCNSKLEKLFSAPAKTPGLWNASWNHGLSGQGKFDIGLGTKVYSEQHKDKLLKERGLIRETDFAKGYFDSVTSSNLEEAKRIDKETALYNENIKKFDGDKAKAVAETWTAHDILNS